MKKYIFVAGLLILSFSTINAQENNEQKFFQRHLNHRVYLGYYNSYFDDTILPIANRFI
jgi:membrane-bound acyltransferase YfiQ involved in biofilm formation